MRPARALAIAKRIAAILLALAAPAQAGDAALERGIKATFLYKFAPFVEWQSGGLDVEGSPFVLCLTGNDPFGGLVEQATSGQRVGSHPIVVRHIAAADARSGCHILFVAGSPQQTVAGALDATRGSPTLTITDSALASTPGIINFVMVDDRVSFDIDEAAAAQNHLVISSKLLALAHAVNAGAGGRK